MIVVVGSPRSCQAGEGLIVASGPAPKIAIASATAGAPVQIVGRVGEDAAGESVLLDLARRNVGHIAVLRDAGRATQEDRSEPADDLADDSRLEPSATQFDGPTIDAADLQLALSYLPDYRVVVVAEQLGPEAMRVAAAAVGWAGAALVIVGHADDVAGLPEGVTVFEPPDDDAGGAFAAMVGTYAAGLDRGEDPRDAFRAATAAVGSSAAE